MPRRVLADGRVGKSARVSVPFAVDLSLSIWLALVIASPSAAAPRFTRVGAEVGVEHTHVSLGTYGPGVALVDFDDDGDLDLFVSDDQYGNRLFRSGDDGILIDVAPELGLNHIAQLPPPEDRTNPNERDACSMMPSFLDLDRDGDKDLFLTSWNTYNRYYINNGDGSYTDHTHASGLDIVGRSASAAFGDYDLDGRLDVYIADWGGPDHLFRNLGDNIFSDASMSSGVWDLFLREQPGWCALWFYCNDDRFPDLYVGNDYGQPNFLFINGGGFFVEEAVDWFPELSEPGGAIRNGNASMGQSLADFDHDGDYDMFVTNSRLNNLYSRQGDEFIDLMKVNDDPASVIPLKDSNVGWFCDWPDVDNDGWQDLYVVNGFIRLCAPDDPNYPQCNDFGTPEQRNRLWRVRPEGGFQDVTEVSGLGNLDWGRAAAVADVDADGDLDIFLANNNGEHVFYRNDTPNQGHWLSLRLEGVRSNPDAIGARVRARVGDTVHMRDRFSGSGYLSQVSDEIHLGLGDAQVVDELTIHWSRENTDTWYDVPVDQRLTLREGSSETEGAKGALGRVETIEAEMQADGVHLRWDVDESLDWERFRVLRVEGTHWACVVGELAAIEGTASYEFVDRGVIAGEEYRYVLAARRPGVEVGSPSIALTADVPIPARPTLALQGPWPNPFNGSASFRVEGVGEGTARLRIVDALGRELTALPLRQDGDDLVAEWTGHDGRGHRVASGTYRAVLSFGDERRAVAVTLVK